MPYDTRGTLNACPRPYPSPLNLSYALRHLPSNSLPPCPAPSAPPGCRFAAPAAPGTLPDAPCSCG